MAAGSSTVSENPLDPGASASVEALPSPPLASDAQSPHPTSKLLHTAKPLM